MDLHNLPMKNEEIEKAIDNIIEEALAQCSAYQEMMARKSSRKTQKSFVGTDKLDGITEEDQSNGVDNLTRRSLTTNGSESDPSEYFTPSESSDEDQQNSQPSDKIDRSTSYKNPFPSAITKPAFSCEWCYGLNLSAPVICSTKGKVLFAAAHMIVACDFRDNQMTINYGHVGKITCLHQSENMLAACDVDKDEPTITVWDTDTSKIKQYHIGPADMGGFKFVVLNQSATSVFAVTNGPTYYFFYWSMSDKNSARFHQLPRDPPVHLCCHQEDNKEYAIITCVSEILIVFLENSEAKIVQATAATDSGNIGSYRVSCTSLFRILTGTSRGQVVVHGICGAFTKTVRLHHTAITCMETKANVIIIGFENGWLAVYHVDLRLRNTLCMFPTAINSISVVDIGSRKGSYAYALASGEVGFVSRSGECKKFTVPNKSISCIDHHPSLSHVVIAYADGKVVLIDTEEKSEVKQKLFSHRVTSIQFSSRGTIIAMGTESGDMLILDAISLASIAHLPNLARTAITRIVFHTSKNTMAFVYEESGLGLLKKTEGWHIRGKYHPHSKKIADIVLVDDTLHSIGHDKMLAVVDTNHMLRFITRHQIEHTALPTALVHHNGQLLIANTERKIRFFDIKTGVIVRTLRSPGQDPIHYMTATDNHFAFATGPNIGVCPLPWRGWGNLLRGHPHKISSIIVKDDHLITCGEDDNTLLVWSLTSQNITRESKASCQQRVKNIFERGPIRQHDLIENLQYIGYFPSRFDAEIMQREYHKEWISEADFLEILFNYGPPPGITGKEVRDAVMSVSDVARGVQHMERLIEAVTSVNTQEGMTEEEAVKCLRALCAPQQVPSTISTERFITDILGYDARCSK